jgi:acetyl-CoA C-acetyltransferase
VVGVVGILSWRYRDPGALVAERVGASPSRTVYTGMGGNSPQMLLNRLCVSVQAGELDVALVGGAEAWRTRMAHRAGNDRPPWTVQDDAAAPTEVLGDETPMSHPAELARGIALPVQVYPMFETAVRAAAGRPPAEHARRIAELWSRFSEVAERNPNAWIRRRFGPDEILTPGPDNRMIGYPYPKLMNSNNAVEQSAGLILCSAEAAERHGIDRDRWVFAHSGTDVHDTYFVANRQDLHSSPAIRAGGRAVLALAGVSIDDVAHVDLYSCFPSAVEIAAAELGLPDDDPGRPLTVTGGLSFAGGPWNNYTTHAVATMVGVLRDDPGALGLCTANGGFLTKHAMGLYSSDPPKGFRWADAQPDAEFETTPRRVAEELDGDAEIEAYTVVHDRDGTPETAFAALLTDDGSRAWGRCGDADAMQELLSEEGVGRKVKVAADGSMRL